MMNSNLNLSALPECKFAYQMVNSALLIPCAEYQRVLHAKRLLISRKTFRSTLQTNRRSASGTGASTSLMGRTR